MILLVSVSFMAFELEGTSGRQRPVCAPPGRALPPGSSHLSRRTLPTPGFFHFSPTHTAPKTQEK